MSTTPAELIELVYDDMLTWAAANKGEVSLVQNPYELLEMLAHPPSGWRVCIHWEGDGPPDERVRNGSVALNRFRFIVDGALGPTMVPRIALIKSTASRTPFLTLVDAVRQRVMAYKFPWLTAPNDRFWWKGTDDKVPLPDGLWLAAYNCLFELHSVLAMPVADVDLNPA